MKARLIYFFFFSLVALNVFGQNIETYFESQQPVDFQKLYLHTDREFFFEDDTLWFAAYLLDGQSHILNDGDHNLYVELINSSGEFVQQNIFMLQGGTAKGNIKLNKNQIPEGKYILRAYTDYLKNFGDDSFFTKKIVVSSIKNSFDIETSNNELNVLETEHKQTTKSDDAKIDVQFMPEGGFLLAGQSNCVAFKALNSNGRGVVFEGELLDSDDNKILDLESVYKGAGKFYFIPESGKKYRVVSSKYSLSAWLPVVKSAGAKLKLLNQTSENIQLLVQASQNDDGAYVLAALHRGQARFFMELSKDRMNKLIRINTSQLGSGINRFVLLDKQMNPVSERLVFQNVLQKNTLHIELGNDAYKTRDEIQLNIKSSDKKPVETTLLSVAVVDENYMNAEGIGNNIVSYLLLNSDLKGEIESPASYFVSDEKLSTQTKLDLLMCTNGWSNYKWNLLQPKNVQLEYNTQFGFDFKGQVQRGFGKKGLNEGSVFFMVKSPQTTQVLDVSLNSNGTFGFEEVIFFDSAMVFVQGRNKNNKNTIKLNLQFPELTQPAVAKNLFNSFRSDGQIPVSVYRERYLNEMKLREFYPERNSILMGDIEIKGRNYLEKWRTGPVLLGDGPYLLNPKQTAGSSDVVQYLLDNVPGVWPTRGRQGITLSPGGGMNVSDSKLNKTQSVGPRTFNEEYDLEPVFWIDYSLMLTVDDVRHYPIDIFETIELYNAPISYFYRAPGGVILLTTKKGRLSNFNKSKLLGGSLKTIQGFTPVREFYSPKYTLRNSNSEIPDYRTTLYWNPQVLLKGEQELFFHACDNVTRYKVIVEGITETGKICIGEASFAVDGYSE